MFRMNKNFWKKFNKKSQRGQFFYPDLVTASALFIVTLMLFFMASRSIVVEVDNFESSKQIDESAHPALGVLFSTSGEPANWENLSLSDVNYFGLVFYKNKLETSKVNAFVTYFSGDDYNSAKQKLLAGQYDFKLKLVDYNDSVIAETGYQATYQAFAYERIAYYEGRQIKVQAVFSHEE